MLEGGQSLQFRIGSLESVMAQQCADLQYSLVMCMSIVGSVRSWVAWYLGLAAAAALRPLATCWLWLWKGN